MINVPVLSLCIALTLLVRSWGTLPLIEAAVMILISLSSVPILIYLGAGAYTHS